MDPQSKTKWRGFWDEKKAKDEELKELDHQFHNLNAVGGQFTYRIGSTPGHQTPLEVDHQRLFLEMHAKSTIDQEALRNQIGHYVQNNLPIRLVDLSTMTLVDRAMLLEQISRSTWFNLMELKNSFKYAILSHRWRFPELTFSEFGKLQEQFTQLPPSSINETISRMRQLWKDTPFEPSLNKLLEFQKVSTQRKCKYAWVDTICINKESSAELDESIRSMYAWYRDSHICIVHLSQTRFSLHMNEDAWFTRGWTLQELLAPKSIKFFSSSWEEITDRQNDKDLPSIEKQAAKSGQDQPPLWSTISKVTRIPIDDLLDFKPGLYDIGKRMSWASKRQTTRIEDMAYCLIGIFRVNLSISYGEKEGAFYRLQLEIMQNSNDQSLFDWSGEASAYNSLFAASPECFSQRWDVVARHTSIEQTSTLAANFERRISRILYHISEVPDLKGWNDLWGTTFTILGSRSSNPEERIVMILDQIDPQCYKRRFVTRMEFKGPLPTKAPSEIIIK